MPLAPAVLAGNVVPLLLLASTFASCGYSATSPQCLTTLEKTPPQRHVFFGGQRLPLRLEESPRVTQRLATEVFRIFLTEVLGYGPVEVIPASSFDAAARLSGIHNANGIPDAMINVEVWIPPEDDDENYAKECGSITFPGRYGWFIPTQFFNSSSGMGHWKYFKDPNNAQNFQLTDEDFKYVKEIAMEQSQRSCIENKCSEWMYSPEWCQVNRSYDPPCATLLAGHADETSFVKDDIKELHLHVSVVWLGDLLSNVTHFLMERYSEKVETLAHNHSLLVLVGVPHELISTPSHEFTSVVMPPCFPSCNNTIHDGCTYKCRYEMQRLVKMAWLSLPDSAKPAFEALEKMKLDYTELLQKYKLFYNVGLAACTWMREKQDVWQEWNHQGVKNLLYIGGIFPMTGSLQQYHGIVRSAQMAMDAVNSNDTVLPDYELKMLLNDGKCEADAVMKTFIDYIMFNKYRNLVGILGPACSDTVEPLAGITRHFRTVVISYSAEGASFSDRKKYPYFFRTIGENKKYRHVYVHILKEMGWRRVAALTEDGQKYTEYVALLQDELQSIGALVYNRKFPRERGPDAMSKYLEDIKLKNIRIIIGDMYDHAARDVMCQAYKMKMTANFGYVWFLPSWLSPDWYDTSRHNNCLNSSDVHSCVNCTTDEMLEAINGHLQLSHAYFAPNKTIMQEGLTVEQWRETYKKLCDKHKVPTSNYAGYAYDAVWTYVYALDILSRENQTYLTEIHSDSTTRRFVQVLEATNFHGVSGNIRFLNGGPSRLTTILVMQWLSNSTSTHTVGIFPPAEGDKWCCLNRSSVIWFTPNGNIPEDGTEAPVRCVLASLAELLNVNCEAAIIIVNVIGFGLLGVLVIIGFLIVKHRYERKVRQTEDYMKSLGIDLLVTSDLDKWEIPRDHVVINRKLGEGAFGTVYGGEAQFPEKGWVAVAVKTLKVGSTTEEKLDFLSEAEVMKRFEHKNIVKLLGVCTKNEPVYTVMEFMLYGDLKTFLLARRHLVNERLTEECDDISSKKLTSMILDVARALSYLAELKYVHRDVASRNCLVNAARVVKLGDFGMTRPMFENDYYKFNRKGLLPVRWMAPESLELGIFTPASDVWSFGVLMYEVITFGSFPFQGLSNNEVLEYVKAGNTLNVPIGIKPQLEGLIRSCWNRDYKTRPNASEIVEFLANNPRLIAPCLDAPASAVQTEDGGFRMGMLGPRRKSSAMSDISEGVFPVQNVESSCRLHSLCDEEFSASLHDSGNGISLLRDAHEPLLGHPSSVSGSSIALGLTKYASLQHNSNDYSNEDQSAVSIL